MRNSPRPESARRREQRAIPCACAAVVPTRGGASPQPSCPPAGAVPARDSRGCRSRSGSRRPAADREQEPGRRRQVHSPRQSRRFSTCSSPEGCSSPVGRDPGRAGSPERRRTQGRRRARPRPGSPEARSPVRAEARESSCPYGEPGGEAGAPEAWQRDRAGSSKQAEASSPPQPRAAKRPRRWRLPRWWRSAKTRRSSADSFSSQLAHRVRLLEGRRFVTRTVRCLRRRPDPPRVRLPLGKGVDSSRRRNRGRPLRVRENFKGHRRLAGVEATIARKTCAVCVTGSQAWRSIW
jgi:hypothetical protein